MSETAKRIFIESETFNEIMRVCTPAVSKDETRKYLQFIEIQCNGQGEGCATALDGFMMSQIRFPCKGDACKGLIPPRKKVKKDTIVNIRFSEHETGISDGEETTFCKVPDVDKYINHARIAKGAQEKEKRITIGVNPSFLKRVIKSHEERGGALFLDIYGEDDAIVVHSEHSYGLLLPVKSYGTSDPEFWEMTADEENQQQAEGRTV